MVNRVVVKVRCDGVCRHIVCGMLHRRERIDLLPHREHDDTARMLPCGAPHAHTALHNAVNLTGPLVFPALLIIVFHISKSSLVRQCTDRPGAEGLPISKDHLCIFMCLTLILAREIQVYIRLLVSLKAQKRLERNVKSVLD